jgi:hypothetical protein
VTPQTIVLAVLIFALVATRPLEERRWRDRRLSDATAALLVVGRLPVLVTGFALLTARPLPVTALMAGLALIVAVVLRPFVVRRLRRVRSGSQTGR